MYQPDALRRAADGANILGADPDQFAVRRHHENIRIFLHPHDRDDFSILCRRLHVDDPFAATALCPVFFDARCAYQIRVRSPISTMSFSLVEAIMLTT